MGKNVYGKLWRRITPGEERVKIEEREKEKENERKREKVIKRERGTETKGN